MVVSRFSVLRGHEAINIKFIHLFCHLFLYQIRPKFCSTFNQSLLKILPVNYKIHNLKSESESCSVVSNSLQPLGLYSPWNSPSQNTGVGRSRGSSQTRDQTQVSCIAGGFFTSPATREVQANISMPVSLSLNLGNR